MPLTDRTSHMRFYLSEWCNVTGWTAISILMHVSSRQMAVHLVRYAATGMFTSIKKEEVHEGRFVAAALCR
jgi:acyl-CoA hydrolase